MKFFQKSITSKNSVKSRIFMYDSLSLSLSLSLIFCWRSSQTLVGVNSHLNCVFLGSFASSEPPLTHQPSLWLILFTKHRNTSNCFFFFFLRCLSRIFFSLFFLLLFSKDDTTMNAFFLLVDNKAFNRTFLNRNWERERERECEMGIKIVWAWNNLSLSSQFYSLV